MCSDSNRLLIIQQYGFSSSGHTMDIVCPEGYRVVSGGVMQAAGQDITPITLHGVGPVDEPGRFDVLRVWYTASVTTNARVWLLAEKSSEVDELKIYGGIINDN